MFLADGKGITLLYFNNVILKNVGLTATNVVLQFTEIRDPFWRYIKLTYIDRHCLYKIINHHFFNE